MDKVPPFSDRTSKWDRLEVDAPYDLRHLRLQRNYAAGYYPDRCPVSVPHDNRMLDSTATYSLLVQSVEGIAWKPSTLNHKRPNLYVVIYQDGIEVQRTHTIKHDLEPKWEYMAKIPSDSLSSTITLRLFHDSQLPWVRDKCLGAVDTNIAALLKHCGSDGEAKVVELELNGVDGKLKGRPGGTVSVKLMRDIDVAARAVEKAPKDVANIGLGTNTSTFMRTGSIVAQSASTIKGYEPALGILTSKLEIIVGIGDEIAAV
ncbi:hypothetical protein C8R44DRAFT_395363 [Mycena epipterygia]|nr:hypothetical protein C8R44DRAFT_395363 [Mycena epipterygia]